MPEPFAPNLKKMIEEEYIRLIFGLKLKQIRTEKNLSLFGLAKITGLSKSYLNEIEKGKKYPKRDKILLLSEALDSTYDQMVSLKLDKNLAPIGEILQSRILKEIPLEVFGIKESNLIDIIAEAPLKVNAFISTLFEIAKHYNLTRESFFWLLCVRIKKRITITLMKLSCKLKNLPKLIHWI